MELLEVNSESSVAFGFLNSADQLRWDMTSGTIAGGPEKRAERQICCTKYCT